MRQTVVITLAMVVAMGMITLASQQPPGPATPPVDTVVTTGEATLKRAAEVGFVTIVAEARAKSPAEAQKTAAVAMQGVLQKLKGAGFGGDAVRTLHYDLQPEFDYDKGKQTLRGYVARNSVEVRVEPVERVGEVIDLSVQSGATSVSGLRFDLKSRDAVAREAVTQAVKNALSRADAAASGAGRTVERIIRIEDHGAPEPPGPRPMMAMRSAAAEAAPPPPIEAGEIEIKARVTVTSQLK